MATGELSRGKSLIVLAVVIGCFAILWPKIFYPMFQTAVTPPVREQTPKEQQGHMRPERPPHLHPDMMHPALKEKGRVLPPRTIERQAKPGPMPGMRPPMGGPGHMVPPPAGSGMGVLMPLYTIGIIVFFIYTIMKIMFKKQEEDREPRIKDFHLDPEQRKFIFAEEYLSGSEISIKEYARSQERLERKRKSRSKTPETPIQEEPAAEKVAEAENEVAAAVEPVPDVPVHKMDTQGKELEEAEVDQLRRRLEETEKAMERIVAQMDNVSDRLSPSLVADLLAQPPSPNQEKATAEEEAVKAAVASGAASKGSSPDMEEYEVIPAGGETKKEGSEALTPTEASFENLTDERH